MNFRGIEVATGSKQQFRKLSSMAGRSMAGTMALRRPCWMSSRMIWQTIWRASSHGSSGASTTRTRITSKREAAFTGGEGTAGVQDVGAP